MCLCTNVNLPLITFTDVKVDRLRKAAEKAKVEADAIRKPSSFSQGALAQLRKGLFWLKFASIYIYIHSIYFESIKGHSVKCCF